MTFEEECRGRAVSRLDAVFLFSTHTSMIRRSCSRRINCCVRIDDYNYAMLDGHVMSATVTSPFPEERWFPVNCGSSSATSVVPSATRFCPRFIPRNDLGQRERETRDHSILIDLRHSRSTCGIEWRSCGAKVAFLCDCVILLTLHGTVYIYRSVYNCSKWGILKDFLIDLIGRLLFFFSFWIKFYYCWNILFNNEFRVFLIWFVLLDIRIIF